MADITVTAAQVRRVHAENDEVYDFIAATTITAGAVVYFDSNGKLALADGSAAGTAQARGIALKDVAAGQPCAILKRGMLAGFALSSQSFDARLYLSNTDSGIVGDAAGAVSVVIGRVVRANDNSATKLAYFDFNWQTQYS